MMPLVSWETRRWIFVTHVAKCSEMFGSATFCKVIFESPEARRSRTPFLEKPFTSNRTKDKRTSLKDPRLPEGEVSGEIGRV